MPVPFSDHRALAGTRRNFRALYGALLLIAFHWSVVLYINSTFLEQFLNARAVSILYTASSILTVLLFFIVPRLLPRVGNLIFTLLFASLECASLLGIAYAGSSFFAVFWFVVHATVVPLLFFHADLFMETMIGEDESGTGAKRGLLLTVSSLMGALATLASGFILGEGTPRFEFAYSLSAFLIIPFIILIWRTFRNFKDPEYVEFDLGRGFSGLWRHADIRNVLFAHFLLQFFFSWMVIYTPLYLATQMGFNWEDIGLVLFIGLFAYVLCEYPIGVMADRWYGEKEMMALGFAVMAVATSWFIFLDAGSLVMWAVAMFMTRVGASLVETTTESYFFKKAQGKDAKLVSLFRLARPASYVVGATFGSMVLSLLPFHMLFAILSILMLPGCFFAMALHDTK